MVKKSTWKVFKQRATLLNGLGHRVLFSSSMRDAEHFYAKLTKLQSMRYDIICFKRERNSKRSYHLPNVVWKSTSSVYTIRPINVWLQADVTFPKQESAVGNDWYEDPQSGRLHPKFMASDAFPKDFTDIVYCNCQN